MRAFFETVGIYLSIYVTMYFKISVAIIEKTIKARDLKFWIYIQINSF